MSVESHFVVRSTHLNHEGHLFGGDLMAAMDELGYCEARAAYPGRRFVTRAAEVQFVRPARLGDVIRFAAAVEGAGTTSVRVAVAGRVGDDTIGVAHMVYVSLDAAGHKSPLARAGQRGRRRRLGGRP